MKHVLQLVLPFLLGAAVPLMAADKPNPPADPLAGAFFPPELVMLAGGRIGLTQKQQESLRAHIEKSRSRSEEMRTKLERETVALSALAKQERVNEAALIAQLDKVLDAERELKHVRVGLLVAAKNLLTSEQIAKLTEIVRDHGAHLMEEAVKRLTDKSRRVEEMAQKWAEGGRDPSEIASAMEKNVKPLIESGKPVEAEAELDRLLEKLTQETK